MKQASNERRAIFIVVAVWVAMVAIIGLGGDYPLNDDWAYAHSARRLLHTGQLRILDWAAPSLVAHVAFGATLLRIFGESNVVLRGGTVALGLLALVATYALSRRSGLSPWRSLLPTFALGLSPWFVNLSFTFMSDVPWLFVMLTALWLFATALRPSAPPRLSRLFFVGVLLGVAALIRQFAVVTLPAFVIVAAIDARRRLRGSLLHREALRSALTVTLPVVVIYACYQYWYSRVHGPTMANRETWRQMRDVDLLTMLRHILAIAHYLGLWLLPLVLAIRGPLRDRRSHRPALGVAIALSLFSMGEAVRTLFSAPRVWGPSATIKPVMPYLGNIFYLVGLGPPTLYPTYSGIMPTFHEGRFVGAILTVCSLLGAVLSTGIVLRAARAAWLTLRGPRSLDECRDDESALSSEVRLLIAIAGVFYLGWHLCTGPFLFDRYILPLLPLSWILALGVTSSPLRRAPIVAVLAVSAIVSMAGTREYLGWNAARADAVHDLMAAGIPTSQIDAGFEWNGTWRFEEYVQKRGTIRHPDSSWWSVDLPYRLTFTQLPGCQIFRRYPFWTWPGGGTPNLYVVRCDAAR